MRAIVTGAASGIGRAVCMQLAKRASGEEPLHLLAVDVDSGRLGALCSELHGLGASVVPYQADLSTPDAAEGVATKAIEELGGLDALVSNAGVLSNCPLRELEVGEWDRVFAVNTRATWLLAKHTHDALAAAGGAIVATASISAIHPTPPHGAYSPSKAALAMLVQQLAYEWGPDGIRVNCVSPGTIHTGMSDAFYSNEANRTGRAAQIPLRRVAGPDEVAGVICFLLGPDAAYVTGENVLVDGGLHTVLMPAVRGLDPMS